MSVTGLLQRVYQVLGQEVLPYHLVPDGACEGQLEAVLGAAIEVPSFDGAVEVKVPPGIRSGQTLRLKGKGWPDPKGAKGDQLIKIVIEAPKDLNAIEKECYEKIRDNRTFDPRKKLNSIRLI
jgi:curved DNA-binding protein